MGGAERAGLNPRQWARVEVLFAEAHDLPPAERGAWPDALSGEDPAVVAELRALLAASQGTDGFLSTAAPRPGDAAESLSAGTLLGPWRVLEPLGRGGMGEVVLAERADGAFSSRVAIKVLKRGLDTDAVVKRFLRERRILGSLQHPHIARLLDAGATADGRPYLVMELVHGIPITEACRARGSSVREVLGLMRTVCEAVQEAHQKLVVHADLKPSNVLVDGEGRIKLVDFGIAKLLEDGGERETHTAGPRPLTPSHAAPEQLMGEPVSAATDVYGLGVMLYELLTGALPHRRGSAMAAVAAVARGEEVIAAPSTVEGGLPHLDPHERRRRARELVGDVDHIVMKALRREPDRRYASAAELGDDLGRYLQLLPVRARPDSPTYRLQRFVRRNRVPVAAAAAGLLALVAGSGVAVWQARTARDAAQRAEEERARAERVKGFVLSVFQQEDPFLRAESQARPARELIAESLGRVDTELAGQPALQADLLADFGAVQIGLGDLAGAQASLERALELRVALHGPDSTEATRVEALLARAAEVSGRRPEAAERARRILPRLEAALGPDHAEVLMLRRVHVRALMAASRFTEAEAEARRVLESGERTRGRDHPETARAATVYGTVLLELSRLEEAEAVLLDAMSRMERAQGADHAMLVYPLHHLGRVYARRDQHAQALAANDRLLEVARRHLGPRHAVVGRAFADRGEMLRSMERLGEARTALETAAGILEPIGNDDYRVVLAFQGRLALDEGRYEDAERYFAQCESRMRVAGGERWPYYWLARSSRGVAMARQGRVEEGEALQRESLLAITRLTGEGSFAWRRASEELADTLRFTGRVAEAEALEARVKQR
jgi:serine/threonine protein kinase